MLSELSVRGLGVIEEISATFGSGMTALTGETGAGKTLVVEALNLLVGARADPSVVRPGSRACVVEGRFDLALPAPRGQEPLLESLEALEGELVIAREVPGEGRSRAWINGRMATAATLTDLGDRLIDLHGQHDHMTLLTTAGQRAALDAYAGTDLGDLARARARLAAADRALGEIGGDPSELQREAELLAFQVSELEAAGINDVGEDSRLAAEEQLLAEADALRTAGFSALAALTGGPGDADGAGNAADFLRSAMAALGSTPFAAARERLAASLEEISDTAMALRDLVESVQEDPERLAELRERRKLLSDLARKYGGSLEEARAFRDKAAGRLSALEEHDARSRELTEERRLALEEVARAEGEVRRFRSAAAPGAAEAITATLRGLAMDKATLSIQVGEDGAGDDVCFLLAANPGEPALPLAKVASGGELARTTLAVRLVTSGGPPTLVFDEVDAGIGGEAALTVGRALAQLSRKRQVIVVTHLPQVASFADHQWVVTKTLRSGRTVTDLVQVDGDERVVELSRMLSGQPGSQAAHRHAEDLLARAAAMRRGGRSR